MTGISHKIAFLMGIVLACVLTATLASPNAWAYAFSGLLTLIFGLAIVLFDENF